MSDFKKLRELAEKATPGPWEPNVTEKEFSSGRFALRASTKPTFIDNPWHWTEKNRPEIKQVCADADFIAAANPETVIALIDKVEATENLNSSLYSEIRRLRSQLAEYENDDDEIVGCSNGCGEVVRLGGFCSTACKLEWEVEHDEFDE